jgi:hypothetical protein
METMPNPTAKSVTIEEALAALKRDPTRPVRVHVQDMDVEMHAVVRPERVGEGIGSRMAALGPWQGESLAEITTILREGRRVGGSALPPDEP